MAEEVPSVDMLAGFPSLNFIREFSFMCGQRQGRKTSLNVIMDVLSSNGF